MSTTKLVTVTLSSLAALALCCTLTFAQSQSQQSQQQQSTTKDDNKNSTVKKAGSNPKKPAESAKNNGDADKVKTDERMSTRGLKPPPKDSGKNAPDKPDSAPKQ